MSPLLSLRNLALTRGRTPVLADISFDVRPGEFTALIGPSGAGKSSIFELLLGNLAPEAGQITLQGAPQDAAFAYMPQRDALMPWRRIIDNVGLGLEVQGMSRRAARAAVAPLFPRFGLEGFERHWPAQLSGGMRQRAALARTLVQDRPLLLLDEPFGALDALTRTGMQQWLEARLAETRTTALLITHDIREAICLADRIHVLSPRPAQILASFDVTLPRPRLGRPLPAEAHALEARITDVLAGIPG
ncbi:ABC transporter ATP-binding protein [Pseudooceanicola sp. CBS1P-1]|uniref:ATP-binding cassette domain-containing protein n=1 Tax=Pseudooceanicola albus TaxID=2692189 RepID=A0A6L7G337_9RHOB|nr:MULTISPECIES: ABC transporter ATP-binding protein [Pseudooceanicola]MBT9384884.1 ABC transporter ATP-binding protein [Pseudooceanicola endophyticus]MXN18122.1 ATP-binding cassette domain-containing protein [Pseudooceanicola albus]